MTETTAQRGGMWRRSAAVDERQTAYADQDWRAETVWFRHPRDVAAYLEDLEGSVFQSQHWLSAWCEVFGQDPAVECFLLVLRNGDGVITLAAPLVRRQENGLSIIEFPDLGVTDYAAPLLRRATAGSLPVGDDFWGHIKAALPTADLLDFTRLCPEVRGMTNPFYLHPAARANRLSGWVRSLPETWEEYLGTLSGSMRDKLAKNGRKFARVPGTTMSCVTNVPRGLQVLSELERMQEMRVQEKGLEYTLNAPRTAAFYRRLVESGIPDGQTIIAELRAGDEIVAANFSVRNGDELIYLRTTNQFGDWSRMAPGLLAAEFLIREVQARGVRFFDFAMGDYDYKRRFGARQVVLKDLVLPLSLRGWPTAILRHTRHWAAQSPLLRKLTGRREAGEQPGKGGADAA